MNKSKNTIPIPARITDALNLTANFCDVVLVYDARGEHITASGEKGADIIRENVNPVNILKENPANAAAEISIGTCSYTFKVLELSSGRKKYLLLLGNRIIKRHTGLLWECSFVKTNPEFSLLTEKLLGYTSAEINSFPGKAFNLMTREDSEAVKKSITDFLIENRRNELTIIYRIRSKSGKVLWLQEMVITERDSQGEILHYDCSVSELTRYHEEKMKMHEVVEKLRELNHEKDQFISVLSHDLKSPYTSILGFSEILLNESSLSQEERTEYLTYINTSSQNQLKLINNLLEWSRLVTGRKHLDPVKINIRNMINTVVGNHTRNIHLKDLELKVLTENYMYAEADERLLQEVFNIFISNAVKYSQSGKLIEIFVNKFHQDRIEVIIKDEGGGITQRNKDRLLKIDQVFSTQGTGGERGTGMSLILADEIVKAHKGELWFYSEEGKGSEFHFTIPASGSSVMVIGENEAEKLKIKNMIDTSFPEFSFRYEPDFFRAQEKIKQENPILIITAHNLPLMNGLQFIKSMRGEEKYAFTPVIVCSAEVNDDLKEEYKMFGVTHVLQEPLNLKVLKEAVEENLQ